MATKTPEMMTYMLSPAGDLHSAEFHFFDQDRAVTLLRHLSNLYQNHLFNDIILCVDGFEFPCHKNVLAASSPYFMAMFSSNLTERHQQRIFLKEMDSKIMTLVLDYIYTGEVSLSEETVQNLLSAANLFQLIALRNGCAEYMMNHVTVSNSIGMYFFARAHQCEVLARQAKEIINHKFADLCREQEFLALPSDKLLEIIKDDELDVASEEEVYTACIAWLEHDFELRRVHILDIIKSLRLANVSAYFFCDTVDRNQHLHSCLEITELMNTVKYYHMLRNRHAELDLNYVQRKGQSRQHGILVVANPYNEETANKFNCVEFLLPHTGDMKYVCRLPHSLYMPGLCVFGDGQIYVAGGVFRKLNFRGPFTSDGISANMFLFDYVTMNWQFKTKMESSRAHFLLAVVDEFIYAVGGYNETQILNSVERYNPQLNTWQSVAPLPLPLRCLTGLSYRGKLYVFGGETDSGMTSGAYRYDPLVDLWEALPGMTTPRGLAGSVVYKDKIYIIGGNSMISNKWRKEFLPEYCVSSVEIFDPAEHSWMSGPELPSALCGAGVVKFGGNIIVIGGEDDKSWMAGQFVLQEQGDTETWVEGRELPCIMSSFACSAVTIPKVCLHSKNDS